MVPYPQLTIVTVAVLPSEHVPVQLPETGQLQVDAQVTSVAEKSQELLARLFTT